jgi:hypothetical protein
VSEVGIEWWNLIMAVKPPGSSETKQAAAPAASKGKTAMAAVLGNVEGSVLGALLGELDGLDGEQLAAVEAAVGRARHRHGGHGGHMMELHRPSWRGRELGPGINAPGEGEVPMNLTPLSQGGVWSVAAGLGPINFTGQLQKPFKGNRLVVTSQRVGATATALLLGQMFVGVDLNQATVSPFDIEAFGAPTSFDMRLQLMQAPPGVVFQMLVSLGGAPPGGTDSIFASITVKGHVVH